MVFSLFMFLSQNFADEGIGDVIPCYNDSQKRWETEADLGMFTMFGRTGAPTKMAAPHEDQKNVCNVPTHRNCPKVIEVINKIKIKKLKKYTLLCVCFAILYQMHTFSDGFRIRKVGHKDSNCARQQLEVKTVGLSRLTFQHGCSAYRVEFCRLSMK